MELAGEIGQCKLWPNPTHIYTQIPFLHCEITDFCPPPPFRESGGTLKLIHPSVCLSVHPSVCLSQKLAHIFWSINDRALIFGMHDPCDKPFLLIPCGDLDLWPTSRSNLLPGGGPQFCEFACLLFRGLVLSHSQVYFIVDLSCIYLSLWQNLKHGWSYVPNFNFEISSHFLLFHDREKWILLGSVDHAKSQKRLHIRINGGCAQITSYYNI